jgi:hypothetical protein
MYLLGSIFSRESVYEQVLNTPVFGDFSADGIRRILFYSPGGSAQPAETVLLKRKGAEHWSVEIGDADYPADSGRINEFLKKAEQLRKVSMVTERPERFGDFGLTDQEAYGLVFYGISGDKEYECYFGKAGIKADEQYIRYPGSDEVYITGSMLDFFLGRDTAFWSDLRLIPQTIDLTSVETLSLEQAPPADSEEYEDGSFHYTIVRRSGGNAPAWGIAGMDDVEVHSQRIERLCNEINTLRAAHFAAPAERAAGIGELHVSLSIVLNDGRRFLIRVFTAAAEDEYYVEVEGPGVFLRKDGRPFTMVLKEYQYRQLVIEREKLVKQDE